MNTQAPWGSSSQNLAPCETSSQPNDDLSQLMDISQFYPTGTRVGLLYSNILGTVIWTDSVHIGVEWDSSVITNQRPQDLVRIIR